MVYLAESGFRVCGTSALVEARVDARTTRRNGSSGLTSSTMPSGEPRRTPVPVLERLGFGATIYVPTAYIGGTSLWLEKAHGVRGDRCSAQASFASFQRPPGSNAAPTATPTRLSTS